MLARIQRMFPGCVCLCARVYKGLLVPTHRVVGVEAQLQAAVQVQLHQNSDVMFQLRSLGFQ